MRFRLCTQKKEEELNLDLKRKMEEIKEEVQRNRKVGGESEEMDV